MRNPTGRWLFLALLLAGILGFTGVWYLAPQDDESVAPDFGGGYVEGVAGVPGRVNPLFASENSVDATLVSLVFSGLTRLDEHGVPFPDLAQTWTVSTDGLVYTFILRPGLLWHDGAPLTAADVVFTYGLLRSPELRNAPDLSRRLANAELAMVDALTVSIRLQEPYAPLPSYLTLGILPEHLLGGTSPAAVYDSSFNQRPVGAGAYRIESLSLDRAELVAHSGYHFGQPFIQRFSMQFFPDEGALFDALQRDVVNAAFFAAGLGPSDSLELQKRDDLTFTALEGGELTQLYFNLDVPLFEDRRLRQALLHGIDRDALIRDHLRGQASRADSPIAPGSWAYSPTLTRYGYDPQLANLLLDEAGWRLGQDGIRRRGQEVLAFTLTTGPDPVRVALGQRIAEEWSALGAVVIVESIGLTTLVRDTIEQRDYQALLFVEAVEADPDPSPAWHSNERDGQGGNLAQFSDERVDMLLTEALASSQPNRRALYREFQEIFAQEVPSIPLFLTRALYVQDAEIGGVRVGRVPEPGQRFWQVQEWFLETR